MGSALCVLRFLRTVRDAAQRRRNALHAMMGISSMQMGAVKCAVTNTKDVHYAARRHAENVMKDIA